MKYDFTLNEQIYFIHIPKTGGSSFTSEQIVNLGHRFNVKKIYRTPADNKGFHQYTSCYWKKFKYPIEPNTKISIIRNPFDLLCSYYHHGEKLKKNDEYCHSGWASVNYTHQFKTFKDFIKGYCDPNFDWHIPQFKKFLFSQLFDIKNNCVADIIIKYEYLDEAREIFNKKLKKPIINLKCHISKRKTKNYKEYYDEEMIDLVNKKCRKELTSFNYDFKGSTKHEPLIINCNIKYDISKDLILNI